MRLLRGNQNNTPDDQRRSRRQRPGKSLPQAKPCQQDTPDDNGGTVGISYTQVEFFQHDLPSRRINAQQEQHAGQQGEPAPVRPSVGGSHAPQHGIQRVNDKQQVQNQVVDHERNKEPGTIHSYRRATTTAGLCLVSL